MLVPRHVAALLAGCLALSLCGCSGSAQDDGAKRPAPRVGFVTLHPVPVPLSVSLGGRVVAFETSEVRPQVNGVIRQSLFTQGAFVRAGQPLYRIDASLYQAAANQASANLASARASAGAASAKAARYRPLAQMQAIAQQDYTDAAAQAQVARAQVAQNAAQLDTARINLRYTTVSAPISGRIGRSLITTGALVNASQTSPLAVISRTDPVYVDIQQSSADLTVLRQALASGGVSPTSTAARLKLENGSFYPFTGKVEFSEATVNEATGTVTLRARFANPQGLLLPGMFVTAVFDQGIEPAAILVPEPALQRDFDGSAYVYLVSKDNKAMRRKVTAERTYQGNWVVTAGIGPQDRVITQGLGTLKQGMTVKAVPAGSPQGVGPRTGSGTGRPTPGGS